MNARMLRQRFISIVGLLVIGGITITNYLFPTRARLLPGYESLQITDQGMYEPFEVDGY